MKKPTQERSKIIVESLVQACLKVLQEEGVDCLTTNRIAEVAGVNISSLYRWFDNKEGVVEEVFQHLLNQESERLETTYKNFEHHGDLEFDDIINFFIEPVVERHIRFDSLHRFFFKGNQLGFDVSQKGFIDGASSWMDIGTAWLAESIENYCADFSRERAALAAYLITRAIQGCCMWAIDENPDLLRNPAFKKELKVMMLGYLASAE